MNGKDLASVGKLDYGSVEVGDPHDVTPHKTNKTNKQTHPNTRARTQPNEERIKARTTESKKKHTNLINKRNPKPTKGTKKPPKQ